MAIAIVDYCKGNLRSVQRGIEAVGFDAFITSEPADILRADAIVLPGVGAFDDAATTMRELGQIDAIRKHVLEDEVPFLGICLGMQLLLTRGDEGCAPGQWCEGL
ncbi:MAG: imidazole glycerol phosphate synthase subunit HisH, partial [Actinobacteria bacterium]|nr:imidazole glycerol phosphate synthase subunit HisH [Actinomycetota bacterium]